MGVMLSADAASELPRLDLASARVLCRAILADVDAPSLACAIVDAAGNPIALERTARTSFVTAQIALAKARASALLGRPTSATAARAVEAADLYGTLAELSGGPMVHVSGGLPIRDATSVVGGLGVSGGLPDDDERLGLAALAEMGFP